MTALHTPENPTPTTAPTVEPRPSTDSPAVHPAARLVEHCARRGITLATTESLTAGLCAATLAEVPGASQVLRGGLITYATDLKHSLAGVDQPIIDAYGVVSPEVAALMACGAVEQCGAELGIGITGVAGPESYSGQGVGDIYVAFRWGDGTEIHSLREVFESVREEIFAGLGNDSAAQRNAVRRWVVDYTLNAALTLLGA